MDLGGSWAPFGRGLARSGPSFGRFWAVFFCILNPNFCKHRSRMGSKRPFGSILDGFWEVLGGLWMDFGRFWEGSGKIFYVRTPALSREAPRSVPMRGGPRPPSVLDATSPTSLQSLPWEGLRPLLRRLRVCRRGFEPLPFGGLLGHVFAFFWHFFDFFRFLGASCAILHFFNDFFSIF